MTNFAILVIAAIIGGIAAALQAQFTGVMDRGIGTIESVFITYGSGGLLVGLLMVAQRGGNLAGWQTVPWYVLSTGVLGLVIVGTIGYTVPRLGIVTAFTIIVATQFVLGALIDHFGLLGAQVRLLDLPRLAGVVVLLAGVWLIIRN